MLSRQRFGPSRAGAWRRGIQLLSIDERSAWTDEAVGEFFCQLRQALRLERRVLADRLGVSEDVVLCLEGGRLRALPPWPETVRCVTAYGHLAAIDMRPVLGRIRQQTVAADPHAETESIPATLVAGVVWRPRSRALPALPTAASPGSSHPGRLSRGRGLRGRAARTRRRRLWRTLKIGALVILLALAAALAVIGIALELSVGAQPWLRLMGAD